MKLAKSAEKLAHYFDRLAGGKTEKIKISHVDKVLGKLESKREKISKELEEASSPDKQDRLTRKLNVIADQIERATWLREEISKNGD